MYEDKRKNKIDINWKSLLIKMGLLLVFLFVVIWLISIVNNKNKPKESNLLFNLQSMKVAAEEYFTGSRLPEKTNAKKKITLGEMFDSKLLVEFKDQYNKVCELQESYAEATKISDDSYTIKIKLVCGEDSDYIINTIKLDNNEINKPDDNNDDNINNVVNNPTDNNQNTSDNNNGNSNNNSNSKPSTLPNKKPSTSTSKPNTVTKPSTSKPSTSKPSTSTTTCTYGNKDYTSYYPVAYLVSGNCAVNPNNIPANDNNKVTDIMAKEYQKLANEISNLANRTNTRLFVAAPKYTKVYNKAGTGVVGYTIEFIARQYIGTYSSKVIYEYHLDMNGNRKVLIDNRSGITYNQGTITNSSNATNISLNTNSYTMNAGDTYQLRATVTGQGTNKVINWSSSNTSVATVNLSGVVTAKKAGNVTITATVDGKKASANIVVKESYFDVDTSRITLYIGDTEKIYYDTNLSGRVSWSTSNSNIATVSSNGVITGKSNGSVTITGKIGNLTQKIYITVKTKSSSNSSNSNGSSTTTNYYLNILDDSSFTIFKGNTHRLSVNTNISTLTYTSSNTNVATVNSSGVITPKNVGYTTITVKGNGISKSVRVYVSELAFIIN